MFAESITGRERVLSTLTHQKVPSIPWVPFAGVHAGKLVGKSPTEVLTRADSLIEALMEVNRVYQPDGQPVVFDLQLEAEVLGCDLVWSPSGPPMVATHPLEKTPEVPDRLPEITDGRFPVILEAMHAMKRNVGEHTALYGLVTGPLTLASHLRGTEIFMDTFENPDFLKDLLAYCGSVATRVAEFYRTAGMDVIAVVDPVVSQVSPRHFAQFLTAPFTALFGDIRQMDALSSFFVCGDATKNIPAMCQTAPDSISVDENIDLPRAKQITDQYNLTICGNIPLTTCMLLGSQQDNMKYVVDLLDSLAQPELNLQPGNFILSPGCDMPYDTPVENVVGVLQAVRNPEFTRQALADYHAHSYEDIAIALPDYPHLSKPLVEVFTLDSDTCAACGYMLAAAKAAVAEIPGSADLVEYKFNTPENIARVKKLGVKNLPSLYINGELVYSSVIPGKSALLVEIQKR